MRLSATKAKALRKPGRYTDGAGLHLFIGKSGKKSWVQRITVEGKRRDIGLGGFPAVSLALARELSADIRTAVAEGKDPLTEKRKPGKPTLREAAYTVHKDNKTSLAQLETRRRLDWNPRTVRFPNDREQTHRQNRACRRSDGPEPDLVDPARDGTACASTAADDLSLGDGARHHRDQSSGRSDRRCVALHAESEGTLQSHAP